jgi:hypothetical protein
MSSLIGSVTVWVGSLSLLCLSSAGVILHDVRAVATTDESKNVVDSLLLANSKRMAAVNAVADLPLRFVLVSPQHHQAHQGCLLLLADSV